MIGAVLELLGAACVEQGASVRFWVAATESSVLYRMLRGRIAAITLGKGDVLFIGLDCLSNPVVRRHELVHVRQFRELGVFRFLVGYVAAYLRHRLAGLSHFEAYSKIPHEIEACEGQLDEHLPSDP